MRQFCGYQLALCVVNCCGVAHGQHSGTVLDDAHVHARELRKPRDTCRPAHRIDSSAGRMTHLVRSTGGRSLQPQAVGGMQ